MPRTSYWLLLSVSLLGCPDPDDPPIQGEDCYAEQPGDTSMLTPRMAELGLVEGGDVFRPYATGEPIELVEGFQGFSMITPYIEISAAEIEGDEACLWVEVDYVRGDETYSGYQGGLVFERTGDTMRAGPLFETPESFYGSDVMMGVAVVGDAFVATDEVMVALPDY